MDLIQLKLCDIQGRLFELSLQAGYDREVMYWTGYLYRYWHILTNEPSREIYAQAPAKTMNTNYLMFHTMAPELAIEDLKELHQQKKQSKKQESRKPEQQI